MRTVLGPLMLASALGACALPAERPGRLGMIWALDDGPGHPVELTLGRPATDDLRLRMTCRAGSGRLEITIVGRRGDPAVLELRSGKLSSRYTAAGHADPQVAHAVDIDLTLSAQDPVLTRFAETGELEVVFAERRIATPNAFAPAHDFLRLCRQAH